MAEKRDGNRITDSRNGKALTQRIERSHVFFYNKAARQNWQQLENVDVLQPALYVCPFNLPSQGFNLSWPVIATPVV